MQVKDIGRSADEYGADLQVREIGRSTNRIRS